MHRYLQFLVFAIVSAGFTTPSLARFEIPQLAQKVCDEQFMPRDKERCLQKFIGVEFDPIVEDVCLEHFMAKEQESCLQKLADKTFPRAAETCLEHFMVREKQSCLERFAVDIEDEYLSREALRAELNRALEALEQRRVMRAYSILRDLLDQI